MATIKLAENEYDNRLFSTNPNNSIGIITDNEIYLCVCEDILWLVLHSITLRGNHSDV